MKHVVHPAYQQMNKTNLLLSMILFFFSCFNIKTAFYDGGYSNVGTLERHTFESRHMGTLFRITMYTNDYRLARAAADSSFLRVEYLESLFSDYRDDSELQKVSDASGDGNFIPVSRELFDILQLANEISVETGGTFDVTTGPYTHLWRSVIRGLRRDLPGPDELDRLDPSVGYELIRFHPDSRSVKLAASGMQLDLGGIAKGYAAADIMNIMHYFGVQSVLIDAGGDILAGDPPPGTDYWTLALPEPGPGKPASLTVFLSNHAVTTSGDLYQYVEVDGTRYSHIIDPSTGIGMTRQSSATVIGKDAIRVDAYATALNVMPPEEGIAFMENRRGYEARISILTPDGPQVYATPGFSEFLGN
jgi:FAD:protein FMN transferase